MNHEYYMKQALKQAEKAFAKDEVPVGAIIVKDGKIIARAHNLREKTKDPTAHAEILAIKKAAKKLSGWRLLDCTLYVTLEPCPMCSGACVNARIKEIVFGAYDPKAGYCGSLHNTAEDTSLNHNMIITSGILEDQCAQILKDFFANKRNKREAEK